MQSSSHPPIPGTSTGTRPLPPQDWITSGVLSELKKYEEIYSNDPKYEFGWWFNYFWKEAADAGIDDATLRALIRRIYRDPGPAVTQLRGTALNTAVIDYIRNLISTHAAIVPATDDDKRNLLTDLLNLGFVAMQRHNVGDLQTDPEQRNPGNPNRFFKHYFEYQANPAGRVPLFIAFRGDSRNFETVRIQGGATNRIDTGLADLTRTDAYLHNVNRPWHPFSNPTIGNEMYFRKGSGDNCLYSVISIADDYPVAIGFPLIEDRNIYEFSKKAIAEWTPREIENAKRPPDASKGSTLVVKATCIHDREEKVGYFLGTENYVYITKVSGSVVHTQKELNDRTRNPDGKDQCKERGVRSIPITNFLAGLKIRRVHLGSSRALGLFGFIQEIKYFYAGAWHSSADVNQFAGEHFNSDTVATRNFLKYIGDNFKLWTPLKGEVAPNISQTVKVQQIQSWGLDFSQKEKTTPSFNVIVSFGMADASEGHRTLFPSFESGFTYTLADAPLILNGMKVIFDRPVSVYPVTLESKAEAERNGN